ncbi:MAG: hypothetical protein Q8L05_08860, partial [Actinomycetota bacterium]|nr:hypothetical protein [Actinomycetota bacterium]
SEMPLTALDVLQQLKDEQDLSAFPLQLRRIDDASTMAVQALMLEVGWNRVIGNVDLSRPADFTTLINRQPELAAVGTQIMIEQLLEVMSQVDRHCSARLPVMLPLPSVLLGPDVGHLALPNLVSPRLDRSQSARTVVLLDRIAGGSGQSLRVLADRGFHIAVSASAAAEADPDDLVGWSRWAIMFPQAMLQGLTGVDALTIQQTVTAISGHGTRLIGEVDRYIDPRALLRQGITWIISPDETSDEVATALRDSRELMLAVDAVNQRGFASG